MAKGDKKKDKGNAEQKSAKQKKMEKLAVTYHFL